MVLRLPIFATAEAAVAQSEAAWSFLLGGTVPETNVTTRLWSTRAVTGGTALVIPEPGLGCVESQLYENLADLVSGAPWAPLDGWDGETPYIQVGDTVSVETLRQTMIDVIWSGNGYPTEGATSVNVDIEGLESVQPSNLLRVDELVIEMDDNDGTVIWTSRPKLWRPSNPNGKLVVYHTGHTASDAAYARTSGQGLMVVALVEAGYTVLGCHMPFGDPVTGASSENHNLRPNPTATLNHLKFFIEHVIRGINELEGEFDEDEVGMVGISGGGWTSHMCQALDTRIKAAVPIAGGAPLYVEPYSYLGGHRDWEQFLPGLRQTLDYIDIFAMGAAGGRVQTQVLNTGDPSNASLPIIEAHMPYAPTVATRAASLGGTWSLHWAENDDHSIPETTRSLVIDLFDTWLVGA